MRHRLIVFTFVAVTSVMVAVTAATLQNVAGTVTGPAGEPISGIEVSFFDALNAEWLATTTTNANGQYDSRSIPTGDYRVRFVDPDRVWQAEFAGAGGHDVFCDATVVPVSAGTTTTLDLRTRLFEPIEIAGFDGFVEGTVVDAATGTPLGGIRVNLLKSWNAEVMATALTDADGRYSFSDKPEFRPALTIRFTDPSGTFFSEFYGAGSDSFCGAAIVRSRSVTLDGFLDRVPAEQLTQQIVDTVVSFNLSPNVATMLGTSLTHMRALLADDNRNAGAACGQLGSFLTRVDVQERRGELSAAQAGELRSQATLLKTALGCQ